MNTFYVPYSTTPRLPASFRADLNNDHKGRHRDNVPAPHGAAIAHQRLPLRTAAGSLAPRAIGEGAGITDQGQISRLLARLERLGLLTNTGNGQARGESNAWQLTPLGQRITEQLNPNTQQQDNTQ